MYLKQLFPNHIVHGIYRCINDPTHNTSGRNANEVALYALARQMLPGLLWLAELEGLEGRFRKLGPIYESRILLVKYEMTETMLSIFSQYLSPTIDLAYIC